jgi:hypothetical protein
MSATTAAESPRSRALSPKSPGLVAVLNDRRDSHQDLGGFFSLARCSVAAV